MESRRLKYLYILKSRAPRALRRPVESCKDSPNRHVPAGPALRLDAFGASRAASASGAARARPGPTTISPARPARGLAPSGRLESSPDTSRTAICGVEVAPRALVRRVRDQPRRGRDAVLSRRSVARRRARARLARVGLPLRDTDGIMTRCGRMRRIEAAFRKEGRTWAFVAARSPFRRAHARPRAPRWSRHGPRLGQNEGSRTSRSLAEVFHKDF